VDFSFKGDIKYHQIGGINTKRRLIEDITARAGLAVYSEFLRGF